MVQLVKARKVFGERIKRNSDEEISQIEQHRHLNQLPKNFRIEFPRFMHGTDPRS